MMSGKCVGLSLAVLLWVRAASAATLTVSDDVPAPCGRAGDAYVVARGARWISTNVSVETVRTVQKRLSGDFLWARCAGKEYLVRDARPIEQAEALFAPIRKLEPWSPRFLAIPPTKILGSSSPSTSSHPASAVVVVFP